MIARASQLFLPTLREAPADAETANHRLLVRGGFVRQLTGGVWTFLPLGWRVHRKVEQIIRDEMAAVGPEEMLMPGLPPAELWERSGRASIPELFHLEDRKGAHYVLPMTHEETVTWHARELQSYRQLPQMLYHMSIKERDEPRPGKGLIRLREFIMKDSYSFDRDVAGLDRSFELHRAAYHRIFERCGVTVHAVEAESGMMGGTESVDFLAPAGAGENTLVTCENGDYAADIEVARTVPRPPDLPARLDAPEEVETPGITTCEALAGSLDVDLAATSKAMPVTKEDGTVVLAIVRGDDRLEPNQPPPPARAEQARRRARDHLETLDGRGDPCCIRRLRRLARARRLLGRGLGGRGAARGAVRCRREPRRPAPARGRSGPRLPAAVRRPARVEGGGYVPEVRRPAAVPDGDRARSHLQARHALLEGLRRHLPRRGGQGAAAHHGLVRDRARAHCRGSRRAEPRRQGDHLAAVARSVRRARRRAPGGGGASGGGGARPVRRRRRRAPRRP